jgi:cobalt-zinc-cadmium efflux system membrane fusion protein
VSPDLGNATSDLDKAQADAIVAGRDMQRQRELLGEGAAARRDVEFAESTYRRAEAELQRARQRVRMLYASGYNRVTQTYTIRSAIEGEVVSRAATPGLEVQGQYEGGSSELFTIGQLDRVWVIASAYEMDLARLRIGAPAVVRVVAYPGREFQGAVDWISGVLDPATRTIRVRCIVDNLDRALRPEMFATVAVQVPVVSTLAIPREAALRVGDNVVVFIERGRAPDGRMRFESWPVRVDEGSGGPWIPMHEGLHQGDRIVVSGGIQLLGMLRESSR